MPRNRKLKAPKIAGFDILRGIMSLLIVIWHTGGFGLSLISDENRYQNHSFEISDLLDFHLLLLCVPLFIYISCFLLILKKPAKQYVIRRTYILLTMCTFWTLFLVLWNNGYNGIVRIIPRTPVALLNFTFSAGGTIYYFFISLVITNWLAYFSTRNSVKMNLIFLSVASFVVFALPLMTIATHCWMLSAYYNPLNFIVYPFAAAVVAELLAKKKVRMTLFYVLIFAAGVGLAVFEWRCYPDKIFFAGQGYGLPIYTRLSTLFFATFVLAGAYQFTSARSYKMFHFLSRNSLGLYCLHPFFILISYTVARRLELNGLLYRVTSVSVILVCSYLMSLILRSRILQSELLG